MKILAVRGENLASLPTFELDLAEGPLGSAGLFAITGPTGAGKTTLLDAICLALYNRTPRLSAGSRAAQLELGIDRMSEHDPRAILRRGTAEARAEVDFIGVDGNGWRATWTVWRSRRRVQGRLQPQAMELAELKTGKIISGHRRSETLELIEARVGLGFDEFRRSVLLAQGDFAAFLRSAPDDRALLLERMTGTQIYSQLSQAAFDVAKLTREAVQLERVRLDASAVLTSGERDELLSERGRQRELRTEVLVRQRAARVARDWFDRYADTQVECDDGAARLAVARAAWDTAQSRRERLKLMRRTHQVRAALVVADQYAGRIQVRESRLHAERETYERGQAALTRAEEALEQAALVQTQAEQQREDLRPELQSAEALDRELAVAEVSVERLSARATLAANRRRDAERVLEQLLADTEQVEAQRRADDDWCQEHPTLLAQADAWPALEATVAEWRDLDTQRARLGAEHMPLESAARQAVHAVDEAREEVTRTRALNQTARDAVVAAANALRAGRSDGQGPARWRADRERLGARLEVLRPLRSLQDRAAELRLSEQRTAADLRRAEDALERAGEQVEESTAATARVRRQLEQLRLDLRLARDSRDLASRRPELLREGEACPLCGSTAHPHASLGGDSGPFERMVQRLTQMVSAAETEARDVEARRVRSLAEVDRLEELGRRLRSESHARLETLESMTARWREHFAHVPGTTEAQTELDAEIERLQVRAQEIQARLDADRTRAEVLSDAREHARSATMAEQAATVTLEEALSRLRDARAAFDTHAARLVALDDRVAAVRTAAAAHWPQALDELSASDLTRLGRAAHDAVSTIRARQQGNDRAIALLGERVGGARREAERATIDQAAADEAASEARVEWTRLRDERTGVLGGRPTAVVRQALSQRVDAARRATEAARIEVVSVGQRMSRIESTIDSGEQEQRHEKSLLVDAHRRLYAALEEAEVSVVDVWALGAVSVALESKESSELEQLQREYDDARAALTIARERAAALEGQRPAGDVQNAAAELARVDAELADVDRTLGAVVAKLERDDVERARRASVLQKLDGLVADADEWGQLAALIGSANGARFRGFAQSLTLELLLLHANDNLKMLRPRYRLQRVRSQDLALQVIDRAMGGEIRSTASLSGGETFLVALALALGLSTLSARDVPIESLFIDEGFGSLDPTSLDTALSALDELQATGRQVGIVSHVPELVERIGTQVRVEVERSGRSRVSVT